MTTDAGEWDGVPFLVMELLDGESLADYVRRTGKLSLREACDLTRQAAKGLGYMHRAGMTHCDVKPSNLWRMPSGTVKVLDLGLASFWKDGAQDSVAGTPDFMAPEQCVAGSVPDLRSDIYGLGCTLFFLLTAMVPFPDELYPTIDSKLEAQKTQPLPRISNFRDDSSPPFQQVLNRMTEKSLDARYQNMDEVVEVLDILVTLQVAMAVSKNLPRKKP